MMCSARQTFCATAATLLFVLIGSTVEAQVVKFTSRRDAVPHKFFDAAKSKLDPANPNRLIIGFDSGSDPVTLIANDFRASTLAFSNRTAMDTISFKVTAPAGYYVSKLVYRQDGAGSTVRGAVESGGATWFVAGYPSSLGVFTSNPDLVGTVDLTALKLTSVSVSITLSLFAAGTGSVAVTSADVRAFVAPLP